MIMTAELNSHQRISYYTGVKLIRHHHHQHQNSATGNGTNNNSNNSNSTSSSINSGSATASGGYFHHHPLPHYPQPPLQLPHHPQQPPLPPHHPSHFHLPCPTGPPHLQHPGSLLHLSNHHGPPPTHHAHHQYGSSGGGGGSNQATRLYAGSPLIRSTVHHSSSVSGNHKKSYKNHNHRGHHHNHHNTQNQNSNHRGNGYQGHHHQSSIIIGRSCSSGSSSSSSSNEQLNNLQSPAGSPTTPAKLDISSLKLTSPPAHHHGGSSSSNTSSPGPEGSPSPSTASNASSSNGSLTSADGNKDLDHFYFLEEHWKPSSEGMSGPGGRSSTGDMDTCSLSGTQWTSSNSGGCPSPPAATSSRFSMIMVDQFFGSGPATNLGTGQVDGNNFNGDLRGAGQIALRDENNNLVVGGGHQVNLNESANHRSNPDPFNSFSGGFSNSSDSNFSNDSSSTDGQTGFFHFDGNSQQNFGDTSSSLFSSDGGANTTMVNVETQIGTFNGQRDLEIRLCFIKADQQKKNKTSSGGGTSAINYYQQPSTTRAANRQLLDDMDIGTGDNVDTKIATVIGDPFISGMNQGSMFTMEERPKSSRVDKIDCSTNKNHDRSRDAFQGPAGLSEILQLS